MPQCGQDDKECDEEEEESASVPGCVVGVDGAYGGEDARYGDGFRVCLDGPVRVRMSGWMRGCGWRGCTTLSTTS